MDKYIIVNENYNSILCKDKYSSRRYRQDRNNIDKHCVIVKTTKGRAEQERNYLNKNYNEGWEIQKVEPIVFYDNAEDREKYLTEYETLREEEIKEIKKKTLKDFLFKIESAFAYYDNEDMFSKKAILECAEEISKQLGLNLKGDKNERIKI